MKTYPVDTKVMWMTEEENSQYPVWMCGNVAEVLKDKYSVVGQDGNTYTLDHDEVLEFDASVVGEVPDFMREMNEETTVNYKMEYEKVYSDICDLADLILGKDWSAEDAICGSDVSRQIVKAIRKRYAELRDVEKENVALKTRKKIKKLVEIEVDEDEVAEIEI